MTLRERRLLTVSAVLFGVLGGGFLGHAWFWRPYQDARSVKRMALEVEHKENEVFAIQKERSLLEKYRAWSLPPSPDKASAEYGTFLQTLVSQAQLTDVSFQSPTVAEPKPASPGQPAGKKAGHTLLTFQVRAKGELDNLVKALETLRKAPLAHRVKALTIERLDASPKSNNPKLNFHLTIDALIVNRADARSDQLSGLDPRLFALEQIAARQGGPTGLALLPWLVSPTGPVAQRQWLREQGERNYADLAKKNIFLGAQPPPPPVAKVAPPEAPEDVEMAQYLRLDTIDVANQQAFLRNFFQKTKPMRLRSAARSGYDTFRIMNESQDKTQLRAKVLRIEQRDVYIQVGAAVYALHIGQSVADALRRPLSDEELAAPQIAQAYDKEWAAQESTAKKGKNGMSKRGGRR